MDKMYPREIIQMSTFTGYQEARRNNIGFFAFVAIFVPIPSAVGTVRLFMKFE
jgi:hypothetical protein